MSTVSSVEFEHFLKQAHLSITPSKNIRALAGKYIVSENLELCNLDWLREVPKVTVKSSAFLSYSKHLTVAHINAGLAIYATASGLCGFAPGSSSGSDMLGVGLDLEFCEHFGELELTTSGGVDASWSGITGISSKTQTGVNLSGMALKASGCKSLNSLNISFPGSVDISGTKNVMLGERFSVSPDLTGISLYLSELPAHIPASLNSALVKIGKRTTVLQPTELSPADYNSGLDIF